MLQQVCKSLLRALPFTVCFRLVLLYPICLHIDLLLGSKDPWSGTYADIQVT